MNTSPQRSPRPVRGTGTRQVPSTSSKRAAGRVPVQLAETNEADGRLALVTESGQAIHVVPPVVAESIRYMVAKLRLGEDVDLPERLGVTSALSGEGTTFIARAIALVLANDAARRVC